MELALRIKAGEEVGSKNAGANQKVMKSRQRTTTGKKTKKTKKT